MSETETFQPGHLTLFGRLPAWRNPHMQVGDEAAQVILDARPSDALETNFDFRAHGTLMRELAERFGCSVSTVSAIWRRKRYTHLTRKGA